MLQPRKPTLRVLALLGVLMLAATAAAAPPEDKTPLSQQACLEEFVELTSAAEKATESGNPIMAREAKARVEDFYAKTIVNGRAINGWSGVLRQMDLDHSGRIVFCVVDAGLGTDFPRIAVTNYDISSGKVAPLDAYRTLKVGDRIRFSGTLRRPIRFADYLKLIPGAELAFGDFKEWGVVASSLAPVVHDAAARRLLGQLESLPAKEEAVKNLIEECRSLKEEIEEDTGERTLEVWRDIAARDDEFREAYDALVGLPFPKTNAPPVANPYDYYTSNPEKKHLTLKPIPTADDQGSASTSGNELKALLEWTGEVPEGDDRVNAFQTRLRRLEETPKALELYRDRAEVIRDVQTGTEHPVRYTPRGPGEPDRVVVQCLLVAFNGSSHPMRLLPRPSTGQQLAQGLSARGRQLLNLPPPKPRSQYPTRTREEAADIATALMQRAKAGEDFGTLVAKFSDDENSDGRWGFANDGVGTRGNEFTRPSVAPALADTAFHLDVGAISLVPYHSRRSPKGWLVIKRVE